MSRATKKAGIFIELYTFVCQRIICWTHLLFIGILYVVPIYIIKERLETYRAMESYLPNSDRHAASWIFSDGPTKPTGFVKLRYNALKLFFDNVVI